MTKGKIIGGIVVLALIGLWVTVPQFRVWTKYWYNTIRYGVSDVSRQVANQGRQGGDANTDAMALACRNRMTAIEQAKRAILSEGDGYVRAGSTITIYDIARRLGTPVEECTCPLTHQAYRLGGIADLVACPVGNNGSPTYTADDHIIEP